MNPEEVQRNRQALEIFGRAVEMSSAEARLGFLEGACGGDERLKARVEALLVNHVQDSFLQAPAAVLSLGATVVLPVVEKAGDRIGRYKLLEQIGEGGCGVVYVAEQEEPVHRRVALKVIKLGMDTRSVIARFEAERQALALMDHPNIAKVLDAGATETGRPYFVMELVRGIRITDYCDQNNLSTRERLDLFILVCHAIQHAHQKGIIHRDIKPSNILVTLHDGVPVPKVIDFGIAKATAQLRLTDKTLYTAFEQFIGTPAYMSPEQAEMSGLDIDTRSDIYALGVLLYELLTSKTPLDPGTLMAAGLDQMRRIIREQEPVRPSTRLGTMLEGELTTTAKHRHAEAPKLIHQLQGDLDWIVMKCLEKDRTRRYETANGLALDIERHLKHEPVVARPPSTAYRAQKFVRRNKVMVTAAGLVALALVLGIVGSTWQAIRATRAEEKAERALVNESAERRKAEEAQAGEAEQRRLAVQARELAQHNLYVAKMNLAQAAWEQNNIGRLRQVLAETQDSPYRGFEWYYWQPKTRLALKTLQGHTWTVAAVAFSPDGQRIVTGGGDGTARVWDAATGKLLRTLSGHEHWVLSVAFSPDGRRILTGNRDKNARVWDAATGKVLFTLKGQTNGVVAAFSPEGQRIVTGGGDGTAKVWDAATGQELLPFNGQGGQIWSVAFSPDGQRVVTAGQNRTIKVWETSGARVVTTIQAHTDKIQSVAFSPDGQRIVISGGEQNAEVWDVITGTNPLMLRGHTGRIDCVAYSPDGHQIVTGGDDNTARVWDAATGLELAKLVGHGSVVYAVAFSPDGQRIVTGSFDRTAKLWEAGSGLSADQASGNLVTLNHSDQVLSVVLSPDGQRIVTCCLDRTGRVWEAASGKLKLKLGGEGEAIGSVAFSPDGQRIVTTWWDPFTDTSDPTAKVLEAASGRELLKLVGHSNALRSVAFSPDGQRILTGSADKTARVWEAATGLELLSLKGHQNAVISVAFSPDGQRVATSSDDGTVRVWDAATGRERIKPLEGSFTSVAFSPEGQRIVTGSLDSTGKVWEATSGRLMVTLTGHSGWICSAVFSPDGKRILTGSDDLTARLWDASSGQELLNFKGHSDAIRSVAFSPDGHRIVTGSWDKTVRIWEAARPEQVAAWQREERAAVLEQERQTMVRVRDSIKQWLLLAPIALAAGQSGVEGLDTQQIEGEIGLRPKAGDVVSIGAGRLKWRGVTLTNEVIDFNAILGRVTEQSVAYAVCYLRSEAAQRGLQMLVGSDDQAKVYLNGKEIYNSPIVRPCVAEQDMVPDIALNAGLNALMFKVVNGEGDWQGAIRFTDAQGNPVEGIKVTLDPERRELP